MSVQKKLKEAKELGKKPVKLSEPEKENLKEIISLLKSLLDEILEEAITKSRDDAFMLVNSYVLAMEQADQSQQIDTTEAKQKVEPDESEPIKKPPAEPVVHPKLNDLFDGLPDEMSRKARELLTCVKTCLRLEEKGEDGSQVLCPECTPEKMIACIRAEDPTIVDELDEELKQAGVVRY